MNESERPRDQLPDEPWADNFEVELVPIGEWKWSDDYSYARVLTCKNHPTAIYYTKNPYSRNLHVIALPKGDIERTATGECKCPLSDLVVKVRACTPAEVADDGYGSHYTAAYLD